MSSRVNCPHLIKVVSKEGDGLEECMAKVVGDIAELLHSPISYCINRVVTHIGPTGEVYIYIDNIEAVNLLLGLEADGSPRVTKIIDPAWEEPLIPLEQALNGVDDWGEQAEIEERYQPRYTDVEAIPHYTIPDHAEGAGTLKISAVDFQAHEMSTTMVCRWIPDWAKQEDITNIFRRFGAKDASFSTALDNRCNEIKTQAIVSFDNPTFCQEALHMCTKFAIHDPSDSERKHVVICFRSKLETILNERSRKNNRAGGQYRRREEHIGRLPSRA